MIKRVLRLLFPPKCVLCKKLLTPQETDLCSHCRIHAPEFPGAKITLSFVAQWTGIWYYKDDVVYYEFEIPQGVRAYLTLPSGYTETLTGGTYHFAE